MAALAGWLDFMAWTMWALVGCYCGYPDEMTPQKTQWFGWAILCIVTVRGILWALA